MTEEKQQFLRSLKEESRQGIMLYVDAICNLKCTYCYIDKNPTLAKIDKILEESFKDVNYYKDFIKEMFPDLSVIKNLELWGGEPTLKFDRVIPLVRWIVQNCPNLETVVFSTNFSYPGVVSNIYNLGRALKCNHPITIKTQISLDGPAYINDPNRGEGVSEKIVKNYEEFLNTMDDFLETVPNLYIIMLHKQTFGIETIDMLQTREAVYEYYKYFELWVEAAEERCHNKRFYFGAGIPSVAGPLPITKEVGEKFANLCRICTELEKENLFKYYRMLTPEKFPWIEKGKRGLYDIHATCGNGYKLIALLPQHKIGTCLCGFMGMLNEYLDLAADDTEEKGVRALDKNFFKNTARSNNDHSNENVYCKTLEEFKTFYEPLQAELSGCRTENVGLSFLGEVMLLAQAGQIDPKYKDLKTAEEGAHLVGAIMPNCTRDNVNVTGSRIMPPASWAKLLLNGADVYIRDVEHLQQSKNKCIEVRN